MPFGTIIHFARMNPAFALENDLFAYIVVHPDRLRKKSLGLAARVNISVVKKLIPFPSAVSIRFSQSFLERSQIRMHPRAICEIINPVFANSILFTILALLLCKIKLIHLRFAGRLSCLDE